jgi:hypothetical protein
MRSALIISAMLACLAAAAAPAFAQTTPIEVKVQNAKSTSIGVTEIDCVSIDAPCVQGGNHDTGEHISDIDCSAERQLPILQRRIPIRARRSGLSISRLQLREDRICLWHSVHKSQRDAKRAWLVVLGRHIQPRTVSEL